MDAFPALRAALDAENGGRFAESLALCHEALLERPADPDVLNLLGRLCAAGGDAVGAIGLQRLALRIAPEHQRANADLATLLEGMPSPAQGLAAFTAARDQAPDVTAHHLSPGSHKSFAGIEDVRALLQRAVQLNPSLARAHAALANVHAREGEREAAMIAYRQALLLDPEDAAVHLALSELEQIAGNGDAAARHRLEALSRRRLYCAGTHSESAPLSVLVLAAPGPWTVNAPIDIFVDPERIALHRLYLFDEKIPARDQLPSYDVVFNAIGESQWAQPAIAAAARFVAAEPKPVLNHPRHLAKTARPALGRTLADIQGCVVPPAARIARDLAPPDAADARAIGEIGFPLLIRPLDEHGGHGLELLAGAHELGAYLGRFDARFFDVSAFVDYRSADGYYRKQRVMFVDGIPYPYHLAVSSDWMIHYLNAPMAEHRWMRDEEERFLAEPRSVFSQWDRTMPKIASAIGLDYFGLDCAQTPDGGVLVFEADAATWIHSSDPAGVFPYKERYVRRIFEAVEAMFAKRV